MTTMPTVCAGNIYRSPTAEALLRECLGDLALASSAGMDARGHRSRHFTGEISRVADRIIEMS